jgi:hypothetical protein
MLNQRAAGTLADAYNLAAFLSTKRAGTRRSKACRSAQSPDSAVTAEAQKAAAVDREFRLALLQATDRARR